MLKQKQQIFTRHVFLNHKLDLNISFQHFLCDRRLSCQRLEQNHAAVDPEGYRRSVVCPFWAPVETRRTLKEELLHVEIHSSDENVFLKIIFIYRSSSIRHIGPSVRQNQLMTGSDGVTALKRLLQLTV